jgi:hypothetical protein
MADNNTYDKIIDFINRFWIIFIVIFTYYGLLFVTDCLGSDTPLDCIYNQLARLGDIFIYYFNKIKSAITIAGDLTNMFQFKSSPISTAREISNYANPVKWVYSCCTS